MLGFVPDEGDDRTLTGEVETAILSSPASMIAESFRQIRSHMTDNCAQSGEHAAGLDLPRRRRDDGGHQPGRRHGPERPARAAGGREFYARAGRIFKSIPAEGLTDAIADASTLVSSIVPHPNLPRLYLLVRGAIRPRRRRKSMKAKSSENWSISSRAAMT